MNNGEMKMSKVSLGLYAKAIGGAVIAGLSAAVAALTDGHIDMLEWVTVASSVLAGLVAVWAVPEFPVSIAKYLKGITSGLISGLASFSAFAVNGHLPTQQEWITIAVAVAIGSGLVHVQKNAAESQTLHTVVNNKSVAAAPTPVDAEYAPDEDDVIEEDAPDSSDVVAEEDNFVDGPSTAVNQV